MKTFVLTIVILISATSGNAIIETEVSRLCSDILKGDTSKQDIIESVAVNTLVEMVDAKLPKRLQTSRSTLFSVYNTATLTTEEFAAAKAIGENELMSRLKLAGFDYESKRSRKFEEVLGEIKLATLRDHLEKKQAQLNDRVKIVEDATLKRNLNLAQIDLIKRGKVFLGENDQPVGTLVARIITSRLSHFADEIPAEYRAFARAISSLQYMFELGGKIFESEKTANHVEDLKADIDDLKLAEVISDDEIIASHAYVDEVISQFRSQNWPQLIVRRDVTFKKIMVEASVKISSEYHDAYETAAARWRE